MTADQCAAAEAYPRAVPGAFFPKMVLLLSILALADTGRAYHVTLAPAESLYVTDVGTGPVVVLVPGLFGAAYGFRHVLPRLADEGFRAIVVEPLGIGNSARPRRADYSQVAQANRVAAVLGHLGIESAVVVGHSAGASIAYRLAVRHPGLVRAVISIDAGPVDGAVSPATRRYATFAPWVKWLGGVKLMRRQIRKSLVAASSDTTWITEDVINGYTAGAAADLDAMLLSFMAMAAAREPEKLKPRLGEIRAPVLLLVGGAKHAAAPSKDDVALLRRSVSLFAVDTIPGVGHYIQEERPEAVIAAIVRVGRDWSREAATTH